MTPAQQLRRQEGDVVHEDAALVALVVEALRAVAEHIPNRAMLVRQLLEEVEVAAEALLEDGQHQDPPHLHAGAAHLAIDAGPEVRVEQVDQLRPRSLVGVDQLEAPEHSWNVVAGSGVEVDLLDRYGTQPQLKVDNFSHGKISRRSGE